MICNLCKTAGDYLTEYKLNNKERDLEEAQRFHWLCVNSKQESSSCFCGHKTDNLIQK